MAVSEYLAREEDRCHPTSAAAPIVAEIERLNRAADLTSQPNHLALACQACVRLSGLASACGSLPASTIADATAAIATEINAAMRKVDDDCHPTGAALGLAIVAFITALAFTPIGFWAGWHYGWQAGFAADLAEDQR